MIHPSNRFVPTAAALLAAFVSTSPLAQRSGEAPASEVLARSGEITLTRGDWDAEMSRIPAERRAAFASSPQRVQTAVNNLLVNKTLAARARAAGLPTDPVIQRRIDNEVDRLLAALMIERADAHAQAAIDQDIEKATVRARELYLTDPKRYALPDQVDASHILFGTSSRPAAEALAAAQAARAKLVAGADFATLARAVSDDPSAKKNGGRLSYLQRGRMDPEFERAAFAQKQIGEISEPVRSKFGYHLIRHEQRQPGRMRSFDEVKAEILAEMRQQSVQRAREDLIGGIRGDPKIDVNQAALDALVIRIDVSPPDESNAPQPPATKPRG